jgi:ABC-2 type transport system ATP-binding protein
VWQNLLVFARIYGVPNPKKKIAELMELLEISHLDKRVTGQLSAGESTRVNLCKAFLNDPELLMLDEPTASLDPDIADKVRKVVRKVQRERDIGILYTSHNMRDIEEVCDRVIFLHKGKIVCEGTPSDIVAQSSSDNLEDVFIKIARDGEILDEPKKDPAP